MTGFLDAIILGPGKGTIEVFCGHDTYMLKVRVIVAEQNTEGHGAMWC
jgi:hypothetical protein